ncbi:hypothetical protein AB1Y20_018261 [Prymnesium parvum]|uniref:PDZ domain-containing protein n=1 Tax=Prymnesium parvum TaxID=97485 RepID=A0AB34JRF8_PRYPA
MLPKSTSKIGAIAAPPPKKPPPKFNDESYWREQRLAAAATLANQPLPPMLALALAVVGAKPETAALRLSNAAIRDEHLPALVDAMYHSECALRELDLGFNELTDEGLRLLCDALCRKLNEAEWHACAFELAHVYVGGNAISPAALEEAAVRLQRAGREVQIDAAPRLRDAKPLCTVKAIFEGSPASLAGLKEGDVIVAFGPLHTPKAPEKGFQSNAQRQLDAIVYFRDVAFSMAPLVKESVDKPISVIVERPAAPSETPVEGGATAPTEHVRLTLVPKPRGGQGLTGCKLVEVPPPDAKSSKSGKGE